MSGTGLDLQRRPAQALVETCLRHTEELNTLLLDIERGDGSADLEAAKKMIGKVMGETYIAVLYPIFEKYPDMKPIGFP